MIDFESQSAQTLLALAGGRSGIDTARCELVFSCLGTAARIRGGVRRALARHRLSDLQFAILVLLFEAEPEPIPMAVLAGQAGVSRSAVTDALDGLEASGFATRARDRGDRRVFQVRITAAGFEKTDQAINDYLTCLSLKPGDDALSAAGFLKSSGGSCQGARNKRRHNGKLDHYAVQRD